MLVSADIICSEKQTVFRERSTASLKLARALCVKIVVLERKCVALESLKVGLTGHVCAWPCMLNYYSSGVSEMFLIVASLFVKNIQCKLLVK